MRRLKHKLIAFWMAFGWAGAYAAANVWACPNCKEGFAENGAAGVDLARGFELSIYLMLGVPVLILTTLASVFYFQIRSARRSGDYPDAAALIAEVEARSS